jgi:hydroxypyruvate reductase
MAKVLENAWNRPVSGIVVVPYGYKTGCKFIEVNEAGHPVPDAASEQAATNILELVSHLKSDDLVIALISGGGSSLLSSPAPGVSLEDKQKVNLELLASGAPIAEINIVRRAISRIKGGRLAAAAHPARVVTLIVSDVPGDDPALVASGPTLSASPSEPALNIIDRYEIQIPKNVRNILANNKEPILNDDISKKNSVTIIARASDAISAAASEAKRHGWEPIILGDSITGEARDIANDHAKQALEAARFRSAGSRPLVLLSGGELTVTLGASNGKGGPNSEYLLALGLALNRDPKIWALACDTDGIDGNSLNAGAFLAPYSIPGAIEMGLDPTGLLTAHRSAIFFEALSHAIVTGPTLTNVNDFRAIAICPGAY